MECRRLTIPLTLETCQVEGEGEKEDETEGVTLPNCEPAPKGAPNK